MSDKNVMTCYFPMSSSKFNIGEIVAVPPVNGAEKFIGTVTGIKWDTECRCSNPGYHYWIAGPSDKDVVGQRVQVRDELNEIYLSEATLKEIPSDIQDKILNGLRAGLQ